MKVIVLSDTHLKDDLSHFPPHVIPELESADLIIHAGDFVTKKAYDFQAGLNRIEAVCGNMDRGELKELLPTKRIIPMGRWKIGLVHGDGTPWGMPRRVLREFSGVAMIIFGHTHQPYQKRTGDVLLFNPGSLGRSIFTSYQSYGVLGINDEIKARIVKL